jgi:hypothetical protein
MDVESTKKFFADYGVIISLVILAIAIIYVNWKINDLNYKVQQTIMYNSSSPFA